MGLADITKTCTHALILEGRMSLHNTGWISQCKVIMYITNSGSKFVTMHDNRYYIASMAVFILPRIIKNVFSCALPYGGEDTVSSKTVAKQRFLSACCMWRLRAWEWRLVLGRKSIVLLLGYLTVFWTCDLAQYSKRYDLFKLRLSLQRFWSHYYKMWNLSKSNR